MNGETLDSQIVEHTIGYTNEVIGLVMSIFGTVYDASLTPAQRAGRLKELMNDIEHASLHSQDVMQMCHDMYRRCINERT